MRKRLLLIIRLLVEDVVLNRLRILIEYVVGGLTVILTKNACLRILGKNALLSILSVV